MIIKSLLEIAFYSSLLIAKKVGATLEENLPFSTKKKATTQHLKLTNTIKENEEIEGNKVTRKEKGTTQKKESKEITPKQEAKIMNYSLKTKKELYQIAQKINLEGRSTMNKAQLLKALKEHANG